MGFFSSADNHPSFRFESTLSFLGNNNIHNTNTTTSTTITINNNIHTHTIRIQSWYFFTLILLPLSPSISHIFFPAVYISTFFLSCLLSVFSVPCIRTEQSIHFITYSRLQHFLATWYTLTRHTTMTVPHHHRDTRLLRNSYHRPLHRINPRLLVCTLQPSTKQSRY